MDHGCGAHSETVVEPISVVAGELVVDEFGYEVIDRNALLAALQAQNVVRPAGTIQTGYETLSVRASGAFRSEQDLNGHADDDDGDAQSHEHREGPGPWRLGSSCLHHRSGRTDELRRFIPEHIEATAAETKAGSLSWMLSAIGWPSTSAARGLRLIDSIVFRASG